MTFDSIQEFDEQLRDICAAICNSIPDDDCPAICPFHNHEHHDCNRDRWKNENYQDEAKHLLMALQKWCKDWLFEVSQPLEA